MLCLSSDIDECATQMHYCQSNTVCVNLPGSHRCDCLPGFIRVDEYSCTGKSARKYIVHLASHHTCSLICDGSVGWWTVFYWRFNFWSVGNMFTGSPPIFQSFPHCSGGHFLHPAWLQGWFRMKYLQFVDGLALQSSTGIHYHWSMNPNIAHNSPIFILLMHCFNNYFDNFEMGWRHRCSPEDQFRDSPDINYIAKSIQSPIQITEIRCSNHFHGHRCIKAST